MHQMYLMLAWSAGVVIYLMTNTHDTLKPASLEQVAQVIVFNSIFTPVMNWMSPMEWVRRRVHAPYSPNYAKVSQTCSQSSEQDPSAASINIVRRIAGSKCSQCRQCRHYPSLTFTHDLVHTLFRLL
jgi:hypothetical protein